MKKLVLFITALLVLSSSQSHSQSIKLGVIGGVNLANVKIDPTPQVETDTRTGALFGGLLDIGFSKNLGVIAAVEYVMKGYEQTIGSSTGKVKLDYIEIPVLLKAKFPSKSVTPFLVAGPTIGFNISAKAEVDTANATETDIKDEVESTDFGLSFGAGIDIMIAKKTDLFFQAGYSLGLSNVNKVANSTIKVKNYGIQVTAGVKFSLK